LGSPESSVSQVFPADRREREEGMALRVFDIDIAKPPQVFVPRRGGSLNEERAMANRRTHKKLRAEVLAGMAQTGDSYQRVVQQVLARKPRASSAASMPTAVDLVPLARCGVPMTLATFEGPSLHSFVLLRHAPGSGGWRAAPWVPSMRFLRPQGVN
jgi:hypothetical protein